MTTAPFVRTILPSKCKPTKVLAKPNQLRPPLMDGHVIEENGKRFLIASNMYVLARIPVDVPVGRISGEALARLEKNGAVATVTDDTVEFPNVTYKRPVADPNGPYANGFPDLPDGERIEFALNARLLLNLAQALGSDAVKLSVIVEDGKAKLTAIGVTPAPDHSGARGLIMPIRADV